jgi:hypothetical protein
MYGAAKSPGLGQFPYSKFFRQNNICMSPAYSGLTVRRYSMTEAAESLIAQLYSQSKLLRRDMKIKIFDTKTKC